MPALNTNYSYEKMEELYKKGMTQEQIAKEIGCGKSTVYYRMKKHSMVTRDRSAKEYRKFDYDKACKLYLEGKSTRFIGNMFGVSKTQIREILIKNGIKLRESMFGSAGANSPKYKGGLNINKRGYVVKRGSANNKLMHRVIAEKSLGRTLKSNEVVHHINNDKEDNRPENLLICTQEYHTQLHARMRRHPYWSKF